MRISHTKKHLWCLATILFFISAYLTTSAQVEPDFLAVVEEEEVSTSPSETDKSAYYFRHFKKLSPSYEGYLIELITAEAPLRRDYSLFQRFGNIYYERLKTGELAYYIIGKEFNSKRNIKNFIKSVVKHQAPEARLVVKR